MRILRRSGLIPSKRARLRIGLLILYLALLLGVSGLAQLQLGTASITIIPAQPTAADEITILLSGTWPNSCVPSFPKVTITGNQILIETSSLGAICLQILTDWRLEVPIGRLPAGSYRVTVTYQQWGLPLPPRVIGIAYFTVGPGPVTIQLPEGADLVIYGPEEGARLGHSLLAGDLNDDGRPDLVFGQSWLGSPRRAYILWGREQFPREIDLASFRERVTTLEGVIADTLASRDLNGDGLKDLIIGNTLAVPRLKWLVWPDLD